MSQVLVLELETRLQKERERLGELRKKHYKLAGVAEGWGGEDEGKTPNNTTNHQPKLLKHPRIAWRVG